MTSPNRTTTDEAGLIPARPGISSAKPAVLLFGIWIALILISCWFYYKTRQQQYQDRAKQELNAIADLKLRQIVQWREERLADGRFFSTARFAHESISRFLANPDSSEARAGVEEWLKPLKENHRYVGTMIYDERLTCRLSIPESAREPPDSLRALVENALAQRSVVMGDFHRTQPSAPINLDVVIPVLGSGLSSNAAPIALVVLQIEPRDFLYPLLQSWPTPSRTAETLLVRREGNEVLFLNDLRHQPGTALSLRSPLTASNLAAARLLRGETGLIEANDYRGMPVVAIGRHVPGVAWSMVTKVDREEIYAETRAQLVPALLLFFALLLAGALPVAVLWRQRDLRFMERQLALEREQAALRKKTDEQLTVQSTALQAAANAIVITDINGKIQWTNHAFEALTGYTIADVAGQSPSVLKSGAHHPAFYKEMWETILAGRVWRGEVMNKRKDGSIYAEEMTITPVANVDGEIHHFIAIKQDVTQRKQAEEILARHQQELERLVNERTSELRDTIHALEQFSYSITHDLRAPLRAMNMFVSLLESEHSAGLPPEAMDYLRRLKSATSRMDNLILDSLNYSKAVRCELPMHTIELAGLLCGLVESYPNLHPPAADIAIEFNHLEVRANEAALVQCFSNLFGNAVKFVAPGVKPRVQVTARNVDDCVRVAVKDNGIGIPTDAHDRIFGMFQRLHDESEYPGTGIGLAVVKAIVHRLGGRLSVESEPGAGSTFYVDLKRATTT